MKKLGKVNSCQGQLRVRQSIHWRMPCDISVFTRSFWEWSLHATSGTSFMGLYVYDSWYRTYLPSGFDDCGLMNNADRFYGMSKNRVFNKISITSPRASNNFFGRYNCNESCKSIKVYLKSHDKFKKCTKKIIYFLSFSFIIRAI